MSEHDPEEFLLSVSTSIEADMIESLLKVNDIPVLRKYREAGGYMMVMMGGTIYGVDIYVPADLLEKAREVVENSREASEDKSFPDNVKPEEISEDEAENENCAESDESAEEESDTAGAETTPDGQENEEAASTEREQFAEEQKIYSRRRRISWIVLFFLLPVVYLIVVVIKYLFDRFVGK